MNTKKRFEEKVNKTNSCWLWTGSCNNSGYGNMSMGHSKTVLVHRWAYENYIGPIPDGLQIDHLCRTRHCVNPDHMEPVTSKENTLRGEGITAINAAKTHCIHGHEFTDMNTYIYPNGKRECIACRRLRDRKRFRRNKSILG